MKNGPQGHETEFARRLRTELRTLVAERGIEAEASRQPEEARSTGAVWHRRGPRLVAAGITLAACVAVALVALAGGGGTSVAWAVKPAPGDRVSVEIRNLDDARGLEGALKQAGLPVSVTYRAGANLDPCGRATGGQGHRAGAAPVGIGISRSTKGPTRFSVSRDALAPGHKLHLTATAGLVFITFTPRAGHDGSGVIEASPTALLRCISPDRSGPLVKPLP